MFNFKLTPLWLFGIIIIVLVVSMLWYNNASIEGFGAAPSDGSDVLKYYPNASTNVIDFGIGSDIIKNYFDTSTGNIIRDYDQTITVIDRAGNIRRIVKDNIETTIPVENDEVHKGSTYGAFSLYEDSDTEQLFYISIGTKTFIHSMDLANNKHGPSSVFDAGRAIRKELTMEHNKLPVPGIAIVTTIPTVDMNTTPLDISGIPVSAMGLVNGIYYDSSAQLLIQKKDNTGTGTTSDGTGTDGTGTDGTGTDGTGSGTTSDGTGTETFALFNNRLSNEELEGFTTIAGKDGSSTTWDIYDRAGEQKLTLFNVNDYAGSPISEDFSVKVLQTVDDTSQVVMMSQHNHTVILILTNVGNGDKQKYKLLGTLRYIGLNLEQPTTAPTTPNYKPGDDDEKSDEKSDDVDLTDSAMSEYWKWFHYWNADGGSGGSQPMSQDYMLKTDYMPMNCPSCSGDGKCTNCGNGHNQGSGGGSGGGGIVGTTGGVANNIIDKTSSLAEKVIDTGAGLAAGGAMLGGVAAASAVGLGKEVTSGAVGLGKEVTSGAVGLGKDAASGAVGLGKDVTSGAVGLGKDAASGAVGLGKDAASGVKSAALGAVGLGREVVSGAVGLGKDVVGGTADLIKDTQYANAGGYASGSNGDLQTRKYVRGQGDKPGGMDPYTYNGLLSKRGGSNYIPLTSDFSSFR